METELITLDELAYKCMSKVIAMSTVLNKQIHDEIRLGVNLDTRQVRGLTYIILVAFGSYVVQQRVINDIGFDRKEEFANLMREKYLILQKAITDGSHDEKWLSATKDGYDGPFRKLSSMPVTNYLKQAFIAIFTQYTDLEFTKSSFLNKLKPRSKYTVSMKILDDLVMGIWGDFMNLDIESKNESESSDSPNEGIEDHLKGVMAETLGVRIPGKRVEEDFVLRVQEKFEAHLVANNYAAPDGIGDVDAYIYLHLMKEWFRTLALKHRYDDDELQLIRADWVDYMNALLDYHSLSFLAAETWGENEQQTNEYDKDIEVACRKAFDIVDAFALAVGENAVSELKKIRGKSVMDGSIDRAGNLAPDGYKFDVRGNLQAL